MNYDYIESLVISAKSGDKASKEKLIEEFKPFIINFSQKTYIDRYDLEDIQK
ncbi:MULTISPECIES: helix-turn-helix domain-containing protein [Clostridium]|uniref:Helix-turn-helix domain-containing protein n=1 Tax=Clostridium cibarium TaxID=2762247 RepID=A0ABR8PV52_9CLOT|nr:MULTISPECIES: helix-turn-helix domain-containing protein [Clostridium]MBD7912047.1 helix-turn-helix domain-containing protein [Clostridium cibarium]